LLLSRPDILKEIKAKRLRFDPPIDPACVEQVSIDLGLGNNFTKFKDPPPPFITSVQLDRSIWDSSDLWETMEQDSYTLKPGQFVLAKTLEFVYMPRHLAGLIEGRSGFARLGISIHLTAPKIDPGFEGTIALEIANHGKIPVILRAGKDKLAQLMLLKITKPLKKGESYGSAPSHVFQGQTEPIPRKRRR